MCRLILAVELRYQVSSSLSSAPYCVEDADFPLTRLKCKPLARWKHGAYLLAGDLWLCLSVDVNLLSKMSSDYTHIAFTVSPVSFNYFLHNIEELNLKSWKTNTSEGDSLYILDPDNHKLELHVGDWQTRLAATREKPYQDMIFFD